MEEILRFDALIQIFTRTTMREVTGDGVTLPDEALLLLIYELVTEMKQRMILLMSFGFSELRSIIWPSGTEYVFVSEQYRFVLKGA